MTNKELIDYCNANWNKVHRCAECPYNDTYCDKFKDKYEGDTPYLNDHNNDGRYYTDEVIYVMRAEQEIKNRIHELEEVMKIAITRYYRKYDSQEMFEKVYSDVWDEMKALHWVFGMTKIEASNYVAKKVMKMSDEIRAMIENQQ